MMRLRPKLEHLFWVLIVVFTAIGWTMKGTNDSEDWLSLYSMMAISNLVFVGLWLLEREKRLYVTGLLDPETRRHL